MPTTKAWSRLASWRSRCAASGSAPPSDSAAARRSSTSCRTMSIMSCSVSRRRCTSVRPAPSAVRYAASAPRSRCFIARMTASSRASRIDAASLPVTPSSDLTPHGTLRAPSPAGDPLRDRSSSARSLLCGAPVGGSPTRTPGERDPFVPQRAPDRSAPPGRSRELGAGRAMSSAEVAGLHLHQQPRLRREALTPAGQPCTTSLQATTLWPPAATGPDRGIWGGGDARRHLVRVDVPGRVRRRPP